jgi:FtsH-binding integral membrane protein
MTTVTHRTRRAITGPRRDRAGRLDGLATRDQGTALLTVLAAFWLFIGAWAVGYAGTESGGDAYLNESVVGVLLLFLALSRFLRPLRQEFASAGIMLLGAWLIISPFIWGYSEPPYEARGAPQLEWATGAVVLLLGVLGLFWARTARRDGYRPTAP